MLLRDERIASARDITVYKAGALFQETNICNPPVVKDSETKQIEVECQTSSNPEEESSVSRNIPTSNSK